MSAWLGPRPVRTAGSADELMLDNDFLPQYGRRLVQDLYRDHAWMLLTTSAGALLIASGLWNVAPPRLLTGWIMVLFCHLALQVGINLWRMKVDRRVSDTRFWLGIWLFMVGSSSAIWGVGTYLLFQPEEPLALSLLLLVTSSLILIALPIATTSTTHFLIYAVPLTLPLALRLWAMPTPLHPVVGVALMFSVLLVGVFGRTVGRLVFDMSMRQESTVRYLRAQRYRRREAESDRAVAEESSFARVRFLASVSHDLRQPLQSIGLYMATLRERLAGSEHDPVVQAIRVGIESLEDKFNCLLDFAKIDAGVFKPQMTAVALSEVFEAIDLTFRPLAKQRHLGFRVCAGRYVVSTDRVLLERIVANLVSNALRYTESGNVIVVARRHRGGGVRIEVRDSGPGVPPAMQEKIFDPFFRVSLREERLPESPLHAGQRVADGVGFGLGLANCRRLACQLESDMRVESKLGHGAIFSLVLPGVTHEALVAESTSKTPGLRASTARSSNFKHAEPEALGQGAIRYRVLVVDDDEAIRNAMRGNLQAWGCAVIAGADLDECLEQLGQWDDYPEIIVSDYSLGGGLTGLDVIEGLRRELGLPIPAIVLSGQILPEVVDLVAAKGETYLQKPLAAERLRLAIEQRLSAVKM